MPSVTVALDGLVVWVSQTRISIYVPWTSFQGYQPGIAMYFLTFTDSLIISSLCSSVHHIKVIRGNCSRVRVWVCGGLSIRLHSLISIEESTRRIKERESIGKKHSTPTHRVTIVYAYLIPVTIPLNHDAVGFFPAYS